MNIVHMTISSMSSHLIRKILLLAVLGGLVFPLASAASYPDGSIMIAQELIDKAKGYYDKGDYSNAIHEFNKALLADPDNQEAREYLEKMGVQGGYYGRPVNLKLKMIEQLNQDLHWYQEQMGRLEEEKLQKEQRVRQLSEERQGLEEAIQLKEQEKAEVEERFESLRKEAAARAAQDHALMSRIEREDERKRKQIMRLNTDLYDYKEKLQDKLVGLKEKEGQINELDQQIKVLNQEQLALDRDWRESELENEKQIAEIEQEYGVLKDTFAQDKARRKEEITRLRNALRERNVKADYMKDRVIMAEYKLADKNSQLAYRDRKIKELRDMVNEMNTISLQLEKAGGAPETLSLGGESAFEDEDERIEFIKRQDEIIADLKARLIESREEFSELSRADRAVDEEQADRLTKQLEALKKRLMNRNEKLEEKEDAYDLLEEQFLSTRDKLKLVEEIMDEKQEEIEDLEDQLSAVLSRFE